MAAQGVVTRGSVLRLSEKITNFPVIAPSYSGHIKQCLDMIRGNNSWFVVQPI